MDHFGSANAKHMIFVWVSLDKDKITEEMKNIEGTEIGIDLLPTVAETTNICQMFKIADKESSMKNGVLDSLYNRIALKNV